jgi:tRNA(Ile)-lysidine synthase
MPPQPPAGPEFARHRDLDGDLMAALEPRDPPGARWLVAHSGGPDSTALLAALAALAGSLGVELHAGHVDHRLDSGSAGRARRAAELAAALGVPFHLLEREVAAERRRGESPEAAARRVRYAALEALRVELGATRLLTAHHRDDQAETLLLRIAAGTGVLGLGGIAARRGPIWRPALGLKRAHLWAWLAGLPLAPVEDPANRDLRVPRSRLRHTLLGALEREEPDLRPALVALAETAANAGRALDRFLLPRLEEAEERGERSWSRAALERLPPPLRPLALALLLRRAGLDPAPGPRRLRPVLEALERGGRIDRDFDGWRLSERGGRLVLRRRESRPQPFSYTCSMPGTTELPALGLRLRLRRVAAEPWMLRGEALRAGFALAAATGANATLRSRRPGDRLRPLGAPGERKLKELLIDRKLPRARRDRLPLLEIEGRIVWVPGVTIDDAFRLVDEPECWLAELEPLGGAPGAGNAGAAAEVEPTERDPT